MWEILQNECVLGLRVMFLFLFIFPRFYYGPEIDGRSPAAKGRQTVAETPQRHARKVFDVGFWVYITANFCT